MFTNNARHLVIVEGDSEFIHDTLKKYCEFSIDDDNYKQIRKNLAYLGQSYYCVGYDGTKRINPEILNSILGTVIAGGYLLLGINNLNNLTNHNLFNDEDQIRFKTDKKQKINNNYLLRLVNKIKNYSEAIYINTSNENKLNDLLNNNTKNNHNQLIDLPLIDEEIYQSMLNCKINLVLGQRGSGKSTFLASLVEKFQKNGISCEITGPSHNATNVITRYHPSLSYIGIDELLKSNKKSNSTIIIDEAASITLPKLEEIILRYDHIVLAGTSEGYEGTGLGFSIKLSEFIETNNISCYKYQLTNSYRFDSDNLSILWKEIFTPITNIDESKIDNIEVKFKHFNSTDLMNDDTLLTKIYTILATNHYQTTPSDLRQLLDNPANHIFCAMIGNEPIGILWGIIEHGNEKLLSEIFYNKRRPQGNLIPQTLIAHCGFKNACFYKFFRTIRIALLLKYRRQKLGSKLLSFAEDEMQDSCDFFGTSFGITKNLQKFWAYNEYTPIKLGLREDSSSGLLSIVMLKTFGKLKNEVLNEWYEAFIENLIYAASWQFKDLDTYIIVNLFSQNISNKKYPLNYERDIDSLSNGLRSPEHCVASVITWVITNITEWKKWSEQEQELLIGYFIQHKISISNSDRSSVINKLRISFQNK